MVGLFFYGIGTGVWDVAMNVEGAEVERRLGAHDHAALPRRLQPRHGGSGSGVGAAAICARRTHLWHLLTLALLAVVLLVVTSRSFLPPVAHEEHDESAPSAWDAWREPRTLLIGLMVLALALAEGTANDWLALALVDGDDVAALGRCQRLRGLRHGDDGGPPRRPRAARPVRPCPGALGHDGRAGGGVLLIVLGEYAPLVVLGIVLWGLGASLGFPVGMSAAADDPRRAAARVSVVSTVGYAAFLAGPPLLGLVADHVGTLDALLVVALVLIPSALVVPSARKPHPAP